MVGLDQWFLQSIFFHQVHGQLEITTSTLALDILKCAKKNGLAERTDFSLETSHVVL